VFDVNMGKLVDRLTQRGYNREETENIVETLSFDRSITRNSVKSDKCKDMTLCLVTTYSKNGPNIHKIVKEHWAMVEQDEIGKEICNAPPIVAFKRNKNLKEMLKSA
jgi:hypothetical protein